MKRGAGGRGGAGDQRVCVGVCGCVWRGTEGERGEEATHLVRQRGRRVDDLLIVREQLSLDTRRLCRRHLLLLLDALQQAPSDQLRPGMLHLLLEGSTAPPHRQQIRHAYVRVVLVQSLDAEVPHVECAERRRLLLLLLLLQVVWLLLLLLEVMRVLLLLLLLLDHVREVLRAGASQRKRREEGHSHGKSTVAKKVAKIFLLVLPLYFVDFPASPAGSGSVSPHVGSPDRQLRKSNDLKYLK